MFKKYSKLEDAVRDFNGIKIGKTFQSEEEAKEYLDENIPGTRACRYQNPWEWDDIDSKSKAIPRLMKEMEAIEEKQRAYNSQIYLKTVSCGSYSCPACGSKINRLAFLTNTSKQENKNYCPVCSMDLRPKSLRERDEAYDKRMATKWNAIKQERNRIANKIGYDPGETILVKYESITHHL